jgi:hypothetical protein
MGSMLEHLKGLLEEASATLPDVVQGRQGGHGFYVPVAGVERPVMFALAFSKDDRIGVKLQSQADYEALLALPGAAVWAPHGRPMGRWVLVPEAFHDDVDALRPWVLKAHAQASATPPTSAKTPKVVREKTAPEKTPTPKKKPVTKKKG